MAGYKSMIILFCSFFFGIMIGNFVLEGQILSIFLVLVLCFYFLFTFFEHEKKSILILLALIGCFFGLFRFFVSFEQGENVISDFSGSVFFRGCIKDVDVRSDKVKYTVEAKSIKSDVSWENVGGLVLVSARRYPVFSYGQCVFVKGKLELPGKINDFDYDNYLARFDIYAVMYSAEVSLSTGWDGFMFFKYLFDLKQVFEKKMATLYSEPHNSFMAGLLLGSRRGIPEHLMEKFNITGLTHIIAISGYNITIIIVIIGNLFGFLEKKKKIAVSIVFIIAFVFLVGAGAAVVRAGIMGIIGLMALWSGRKYYVTLGLLWAAFLMNLWNPKILVYDVGFQLSFLATCGLIYVSPLIERFFKFLPEWFCIRDSIVMTLSAQVLVLPIIFINFGRLSLISPIANLFVLPFIPLTMFFGFLGVSFGFLFAWFGEVISFVGYFLLEIIIFFVDFFSRVKFASVEVDWFNEWFLFFYYFFVGILIFSKLRTP